MGAAAAAASSAASSAWPGEAVAVSAWHWNLSSEQAGIESHPRAAARRPTTMYLALRHGICLPTTRWWRGGHQVAIAEALAARQRTYSVFIAHDLDEDNTRLLRDGRISAVLHHDLNQDMRQACHAIMQAHNALPGAPYPWPSNIHIITPYNMPAPALSHP